MKIDLVEITNFRKLNCCQIDFDEKKTLLVGANNSGKTTAMIALRKFLISPKILDLRDISIGNWAAIDQIGQC
jgi:predicted ATP-dependent endonuclease of OLD family